MVSVSVFGGRKASKMPGFPLIIIKYNNKQPGRRYLYYACQVLLLVSLAVGVHYVKLVFFDKSIIDFYQQTSLEYTHEESSYERQCKHLFYETALLRQQINEIKEQLEEIQTWRSELQQDLNTKLGESFDRFYSDQIGKFDYAAEYAGGCIISTPETVSYPAKRVLRILGAIDWVLGSKPNLILQHTTSPGQCYAFRGNQGRIRIKLGRPIVITHVSLEHIRIGDTLDSAPKKFQVLGLSEFDHLQEDNLGNFTYDLESSAIQTFRTVLRKKFYDQVELKIFDNYGNQEFTCVYRFRVHSSFE